ncbi:MAG TPA: DegT/DnrJ/EryC1/StrS aminotransferase family protein [Trichocoleus sp.]
MTSPFLEKVPFVDLSWQHEPLKAEIIHLVETVLQQGDFVLGEAVSAFESAFAAACGSGYAVGVGCGTDAIALGLTACGIGPGDEVILPTNTFVATLIGVLRAGAKPVLVDCHSHTALIDLAAANRVVTPRTRAIVPVHLYGQMVSPLALKRFADRHKLLIFEDAAQAHLAEREGYRAGSVGQAAAFSFYPSKNLGALGDGGLLVTQDETAAQTAKSLRNYGASRKYFHTEPIGTNSRLDTLQASVLQLKLPYLPQWNQARNQLAQYYDEQLKPLVNYGLMPICNESGEGHVYHLYVVRITPHCPVDRTLLQVSLEAAGIQTGIHYPIPCHLQPAFESLGYQLGDFPQAEALSHEILSLPLFPGMTTAQIDRVVAVLYEQLSQASLAFKKAG